MGVLLLDLVIFHEKNTGIGLDAHLEQQWEGAFGLASVNMTIMAKGLNDTYLLLAVFVPLLGVRPGH